MNIFFVLSGYLIGGTLLKALLDTRKPFLLGYLWMRRWLRMLPASLVVLGGGAAVWACQGKLLTESATSASARTS